MIKPTTIPNETVTALLTRLSDEFKAYYFYRSAANWCKNVGFFKASAYFEKESADELTHAKGIENYLVDWNVNAQLPTIEQPPAVFVSLVDVIERAYQLELNLYRGYEMTSQEIISRSEYSTFDFLATYRDIQTKSVAEYSDMLNTLEGVEIQSKFQLLLLEENLFGEG